MRTFGKKLKECREVKKISQNELAKLISAHHSIIGKYKRDEVRPSIDVAVKIAKELNTTVGYLLGEADNNNAFQDPLMLKRFQYINNFGDKDKTCLLTNIDYFIKASKVNSL